MNPQTEQNFTVNVIVSGQPTPVEVNRHQKVEHLIREALQASGNKGQPTSEWELRTVNGQLLDPSISIEAAGIVKDATLYLTPRTGAGG